MPRSPQSDGTEAHHKRFAKPNRTWPCKRPATRAGRFPIFGTLPSALTCIISVFRPREQFLLFFMIAMPTGGQDALFNKSANLS